MDSSQQSPNNKIEHITNTQIEETLDLTPLEGEVVGPEPITPPAPMDAGDQSNTDYDFARSKMREVIETGSAAVEEAAALADSSQSARSYEVLAKLIDSVINGNEKLLHLSRQRKDINAIGQARHQPANVTNQMFVGSTKDLLDIVRKNNGQ